MTSVVIGALRSPEQTIKPNLLFSNFVGPFFFQRIIFSDYFVLIIRPDERCLLFTSNALQTTFVHGNKHYEP